jgi:hypothetical protein
MLTKLSTLSFIVAICLVVVMAIPASDVMADVRVTVTFAAGGIACGFYVFFYLTSGYMPERLNGFDEGTTALLNFSTTGWQVRPPDLNYMEYGGAGHVPYINMIQFQF